MTKPKSRIISMVWGDSYLDEFLGITLPAVLAPGNLPALIESLDCEMVLVTETRFFDRIADSPVGQQIRKLCPLRFVPMDDLIAGIVGYGLALTHALHRGFTDLGDAMCDVNLIFFNADFILADGSWRNLAQHILAGERLIFAPSYCVVSEAVAPMLTARLDSATQAIVVPPREMAAIGLANLHNTVRAKTINRQTFHMHVTDQMYWQVDADTLLGHQLPIAIVSMRPEQIYIDPISFWDYATISMACPSARRCVLGDSDDFLMLELRKRDTFMELMRDGTLSPETVGKGLGEYMTADQLDMGRYPLTLHSGDLPPAVATARAELKCFVDKVYAVLPLEPVSPVDHKFWVQQERDYGPPQQYRNHLTGTAYRQRLVEAARHTPDEADDGPWEEIKVDQASEPGPPATALRQLFGSLFGFVPTVTSFHPMWGHYRNVTAAVDAVYADNSTPNALFVGAVESPIRKLLSRRPGRHHMMTALALLTHNLPREMGDLDLVLCDLDWMEAHEFCRMFALIRRRMKPNGIVLMHHGSRILRGLRPEDAGSVVSVLAPADTNVAALFTGSPEVAANADDYMTMLTLAAQKPIGYEIYLGLQLLLALPRSFQRNRAAARQPGHIFAAPCTSLLLVVTLD
jgi:hypothetical protein